MNMRMIMFIIFSDVMVLSFISEMFFILDSDFGWLAKIFQSLAIKVGIVCICYFMFF